MGVDLGTAYHHLDQEVDNLAIHWCEFDTLFRDGSQIDLLNKIASTFFYIVQQLLYQDAMLHLSRLTDPAAQGSYENLTIRRLPALVTDGTFKARLEATVSAAVGACQFARAWRDKRLAHGDFDVITGSARVSLPDVHRDKVARAIDAIGEVLRLLAKEYGTYTKSRTPPRPNPWGAKALVGHLRRTETGLATS
jgi:hypothetical protein